MRDKSVFACWGLVVICLSFTSCAPSGGTQTIDSQIELSKSLDELEKRWSVECSDQWVSSSRETPCTKPAFREIVANGPSIAPLIADRIRRYEWSKEISSISANYDPHFLPWVRVLEAVTSHHLKDDPVYRERILANYRKHGTNGAIALDPQGEAYEPEIAIPMMLAWWDGEGKHQFNSGKD